MILLDKKFSEKEIYTIRESSKEYRQARESYLKVLKDGGRNEIDDAVILMETVGNDIVYKKGFQDGLRFLLKVMVGKEVIAFHEPLTEESDGADTAIMGVENGLRIALKALVDLEEVFSSLRL